MRDISAAKAAEKRLAERPEALRASEERYRTVFQTSPDAVSSTASAMRNTSTAIRAFLDI